MKLQLKPLKLLSICLRLAVEVRLLQLTAHAHLIREGGGWGRYEGGTDLKRAFAFIAISFSLSVHLGHHTCSVISRSLL